MFICSLWVYIAVTSSLETLQPHLDWYVCIYVYSKQHFLFENRVSSSSLAISRNFFFKTNERKPNQKQTVSWRHSPTVALCDHKMAHEPLEEPSRLTNSFSGAIDCKHINRMPKYRSPIWGFYSSWVPGLIPKTSVLFEVIFVNAFQHTLTSAARSPLYLNSISTVLRGQGSCPSSWFLSALGAEHNCLAPDTWFVCWMRKCLWPGERDSWFAKPGAPEFPYPEPH